MRRGNGDRGAVLVEFALTLPLLMMLLLGMFTGGFALAAKNSMTNAVREGARLGATSPSDANWASAVQGRVLTLAASDLTSSQVCAKLVKVGTGTLWATSCSFAGSAPAIPSSTPTGSCVSMVWAARTADFDAFVYRKTLDLAASAVGQYERTC